MTLKEEDTVKHSADIAIIGGSGLYQMADLTNQRSVSISTPYGKPSDDIILGELNGVTVAFLTRHGQGHKLINLPDILSLVSMPKTAWWRLMAGRM